MSKFDSINTASELGYSERQQLKLLREQNEMLMQRLELQDQRHLAEMQALQAQGAALAERSEALHAQGQLMLQQIEVSHRLADLQERIATALEAGVVHLQAIAHATGTPEHVDDAVASIPRVLSEGFRELAGKS